MLKLYQNIHDLRKKNKWTQEELASRMGYTDRSMISKIEAGKVDIGQSKILEFAKVFNVDAGDLMGDDNESLLLLDQTDQEFIDLYKSADPEIQSAVLTLLKSSRRGS